MPKKLNKNGPFKAWSPDDRRALQHDSGMAEGQVRRPLVQAAGCFTS
jgi:hypothetical protein